MIVSCLRTARRKIGGQICCRLSAPKPSRKKPLIEI